MADVTQQQLVADLARQVVLDVAPKELPLFRPLSQAYFKDPDKTLKGTGGADQMLGFGGVAAVGALLTPAILKSTQVGLDSFVGGFVRNLNRDLDQLHAWLSEAAARPAAAVASPATPPTPAPSETASGPSIELLEEVQRVVLAQLQSLHVPDDQCPLLAGKICAMFAEGKIVEETLAREHRLEQQVQELKIEVDQIKKARDVEQIVGSEYFTSLRQRATELRQQMAHA